MPTPDMAEDVRVARPRAWSGRRVEELNRLSLPLTNPRVAVAVFDEDPEWLGWLKAKWVLVLGLLVLAGCGYRAWGTRAVQHPPGVLVVEEPLQENLADGPSWTAKEHHFKALARFHIRSRVLSTERYRWDRPAEISPVDFALGWGRMSDTAVLEKLHIDQSDRWFHWSARTLPMPMGEITSHAANMHLIPANKAVEGYLLRVREGQVVTLDGYLVHVDAKDGFHWETSMTRDDVGDGACEVVWVARALASDQ